MKSESSEDARNSESDRPIRLRRKKKRKRQNFISPSSILTVFPDLEPGVLCQLAELDNPTPSAVLNLVPEASSAELGQFFDLLNGTPPPRPTPVPRESSILPGSESHSLLSELKEKGETKDDVRYCVEISKWAYVKPKRRHSPRGASEVADCLYIKMVALRPQNVYVGEFRCSVRSHYVGSSVSVYVNQSKKKKNKGRSQIEKKNI